MLENEYPNYVIDIYRRHPRLQNASCHFHVACQSHVDPNSLQKETWYTLTAIFIVNEETGFPDLSVSCSNQYVCIISDSVFLCSHIESSCC